jgi:hypothetical protein
MPLGSVSYEQETNANAERLIWLAPNVVDRLWAVCGPGESYSDVILRWRRKGPDKSGHAPLLRRPDEKPKRGQRQKGADNQRHSNQEIKPVFTRHSRPPFTTRSC